MNCEIVRSLVLWRILMFMFILHCSCDGQCYLITVSKGISCYQSSKRVNITKLMHVLLYITIQAWCFLPTHSYYPLFWPFCIHGYSIHTEKYGRSIRKKWSCDMIPWRESIIITTYILRYEELDARESQVRLSTWCFHRLKVNYMFLLNSEQHCVM